MSNVECRMSNVVWKTPWTLSKVPSAPIWYSPVREKCSKIRIWGNQIWEKQTEPTDVISVPAGKQETSTLWQLHTEQSRINNFSLQMRHLLGVKNLTLRSYFASKKGRRCSRSFNSAWNSNLDASSYRYRKVALEGLETSLLPVLAGFLKRNVDFANR